MRTTAAVPSFYDEVPRGDVAAADRIFAHCRSVLSASRARPRFAGHARYAATASAMARLCRRLGRPLPRFSPPLPMSGGAGALEGRRFLVAADHRDTRDLLAVMVTWCGGQVATAPPDGLEDAVARFSPDVVLIDLPFDHLAAFAVAGRLRAERERDGGKPRLVALTKHAQEHREADALRAGFDARIVEPVDPERFERMLMGLVRTPT